MSEDNKRKAMRLRNYDYSSNGAYFITVCVKDMKRVLSDVVGADDLGSPQIRLTKYGRIVENNILKMNGIKTGIITEISALLLLSVLLSNISN